MVKPMLTLDRVSKYYVSGRNVAAGLQEVSLSFCRGEFVAVTGESGSGKSTLGRILAGILPYESGEMYFGNGTTSHFDTEDWERFRREQVSFISQDYGILPGATVWDHVLSALRLSGVSPEQWQERGQQILQTVELWDLRKRRGSKLSSGQKQRLAIARALAKPSPILVADEPTGNLDPDNSKKVLELLSQASRDRLVILITHEFPEAEPYVTRHISLHDGRVIADAVLKPSAEPGQAEQRHRQDRGLSRYVASLQLRSRPVWSMTVLMCFLLTAFSVFTFLGTFLGALDDTDTRVYRADAFANGDPKRIIAVRKDGKPMGEEDYARILEMEYVRLLEKFGYVRDMTSAWREDVDYTIHNTLHNIGTPVDPVNMVASSVEILGSKSFVQTVPLVAEGITFLTAGQLPSRFDQVVISGDAELIGQKITVYLQDRKNWSSSSWIKLEVQVVGVTELGSGLYFHEDVGRMLTHAYYTPWNVYMPWYQEVASDINYVDYRDANTRMRFQVDCVPTEYAVFRPVGDDECMISFREYQMRTEGLFVEGSLYTYLYDCGVWADEGRTFHILGVHDSTLPNLLAVSPGAFDALMDAQLECNGDQVSLSIADFAYTDRVIAELDQAGYHAMSPYVTGSVEVDEGLAAKRTQTLNFSMAALAAVVLLLVLLLRALFAVQNASYGILSNLGLSWNTARKATVLEFVLFLVPGQLLSGGLVLICGSLGAERIVNISKFLTPGGWCLVSLVHMLGCGLAAVAVLSRLRREVYPASERIVDLVLDDEEADDHD